MSFNYLFKFTKAKEMISDHSGYICISLSACFISKQINYLITEKTREENGRALQCNTIHNT